MANDRRPLMIIASIAGFLAVFLFRRNLAAEASLFSYFGLLPEDPESAATAVDSVAAIFRYPLAGFVYFDFFDTVNVLLVAILFLPLLKRLRSDSKNLFLLSSILLAACVILYAVSDTTLPTYLNLDDAGRLEQILGRSRVYGILGDLAILMFYSFSLAVTVSMYRYGILTVWTRRLGLLTGLVGIMYFPLGPMIGEYRYLAIVAAAPFTVVWHFSIAFHTAKAARNG